MVFDAMKHSNLMQYTFSLEELELKPAYFSVWTSLEINFFTSSRDPTLATVSFCGLAPGRTRSMSFYLFLLDERPYCVI